MTRQSRFPNLLTRLERARAKSYSRADGDSYEDAGTIDTVAKFALNKRTETMADTFTHSTGDSELLLLRNRINQLERQLAERSQVALDREVNLFVEALSVLLVSRTPTEVLPNIIELGRRFISADAYAVWRKRNQDSIWYLASSAGLSEQFVREGSISSIGHPELPAEPMTFEDIERELLLVDRRTSLRAEGIRSMLAVPLRIHGEGSGTVVFYWRTRHRFTATETLTAKSLGTLAAAALRTAEIVECRTAELELLTDGVPALISYLDAQQRFRRVNHAYEEFFGLKREQILGRTVAEIVGPEHYEVARPYIDQALMGERVKFRSRVRRCDGTLRDIELSYAPDVAPDGTVRGIAVMVHDITEQYRAEEARARLAAIVNSSEDAIVSKTLDGIITSWNPAAERIFGYSAADAVGRSITLITPKERLAEEEDVLARLRLGEKVDHFETERQTKDGRRINISLTISPVRNADGKIIGASKIARDITEKRRSEERLLTSERYLQAVLDSMPECMKVLGPDGTVLQINRAGVQMLEADTPEQLLGRCVYPIINESDREAFRSVNENVFRGGPGGTMEFGVTGLKGTERTFETNIVPLLNAVNRAVGALSVTRDISERKRAEAERRTLLEREKKARETAELLNRVGPILSAELDPRKLTQKITDIVTQAVRAEFGALFHNVLNESGESYVLYMLSGAPREAFENFPMPRNTHVFGPTFRGEGPVRSDDITKDPRYAKNPPYYGMPQGHLPVCSYLAVPVVSRTGKVLGGLFFGHSQIGIFTEEAEQIATGIAGQAAIALDNAALFADSQRSQDALWRSNEELKRANEDLNQFAHSASHDLQEPLRTVSIYSQLLRRKFEGRLDPEAEQYIRYVVRGAARMEALVRDLLAYTQASSPSDQPALVVDANAALDGALSNLRAAIESSEAYVTYGTLPKVRIPQVHLTQLFQNLIGNAIKYVREQPPRVKIGAEPRKTEWLFSVEDNGIGIEEKYKEHIFGIFKRLHTADEYSGTGIGLAICQRIVERAGGRIWVESQLGRGSTFFFTLPSGE
jgi:PAS domain S-box-containing protein